MFKLDIKYISACGFSSHDIIESKDLNYIYDKKICLLKMLKEQEDLINVTLFYNDCICFKLDF